MGVKVKRERTQQRGRRAFVCLHETRGVRDCNRRVFLMPDEDDRVPECTEHGAMVSQPNRVRGG